VTARGKEQIQKSKDSLFNISADEKKIDLINDDAGESWFWKSDIKSECRTRFVPSMHSMSA
jgi:hypothetical protein